MRAGKRMVYERRLWWFEDRQMYVYFTPHVWRSIRHA